jgi:CheY-like chemotaxis protein
MWDMEPSHHERPGMQGYGYPREHISILIVDDDHTIAELLSHVLDGAGYQTYTAHNARAALQIALREHPALVLTDWLMPDITGYELMRQLHQNPDTADIPVVLMSSQRPDFSALRGLLFLAKPFDLDEVLTTVRAYTRGRKSEDIH